MDGVRELQRATRGPRSDLQRHHRHRNRSSAVGVALGLAFAFGYGTAGLVVAHRRLNLLGFVGLTIVGLAAGRSSVTTAGEVAALLGALLYASLLVAAFRAR